MTYLVEILWYLVWPAFIFGAFGVVKYFLKKKNEI